MRRFSLTALLAVPLLLVGSGTLRAHPPVAANFGCAGYCFKLFPYIHQHGPLFNYGPYYGYYPFTPYGPWDAYLRYDPLFYGDQSAQVTGNVYGRNPRLGYLHAPAWFHKAGCTSCGFHHASWLQGGWFRGHKWLDGGHGDHHHAGCTSCGGVAVAPAPAATRDPAAKYSGIGSPAQSAVFYAATPTLDPTLELVPTAGRTK
ncbi:MAG: hypothetical protein J0I06_17155 [Planctomycetes bacterium]|nr:hypothetical protein [Planctomycetota bacterium]